MSARPERTQLPDRLDEALAAELNAADFEAAELDETATKVLDFERAWTARPGAKEAAIRAEFGWSAARYYQVLSALIDSPVAVRSDPLLVRRLQRVRDARAGARAARTFRIDPTPSPQDPTD